MSEVITRNCRDVQNELDALLCFQSCEIHRDLVDIFCATGGPLTLGIPEPWRSSSCYLLFPFQHYH